VTDGLRGSDTAPPASSSGPCVHRRIVRGVPQSAGRATFVVPPVLSLASAGTSRSRVTNSVRPVPGLGPLGGIHRTAVSARAEGNAREAAECSWSRAGERALLSRRTQHVSRRRENRQQNGGTWGRDPWRSRRSGRHLAQCPRGGSSVGQSSGLIIRRSEVQVLPAPRPKPLVKPLMSAIGSRLAKGLYRVCTAGRRVKRVCEGV
jgi:hypothetical protein